MQTADSGSNPPFTRIGPRFLRPWPERGVDSSRDGYDDLPIRLPQGQENERGAQALRRANKPNQIDQRPSPTRSTPVQNGIRFDSPASQSSARRALSNSTATTSGSDNAKPKSASETNPATSAPPIAPCTAELPSRMTSSGTAHAGILRPNRRPRPIEARAPENDLRLGPIALIRTASRPSTKSSPTATNMAPSSTHAAFCTPKNAVPIRAARRPSSPMKIARVAANRPTWMHFVRASFPAMYLMNTSVDPIEHGSIKPSSPRPTGGSTRFIKLASVMASRAYAVAGTLYQSHQLVLTRSPGIE